MDISRFTERARSILQAAQGLAAEHNHQFITGSHLGLSLSLIHISEPTD